MQNSLQKAQELLNKYFGYSSFREGQERIITSILQGEDTLGIMPTGGGKSICYQIPALMLPGTTLVISPLISLMKDQVDALSSLGIPATFINSSLDYKETNERMNKAAKGEYKLLYIAPERLETESFTSLLFSLPISLIAIDEAHCISQWGHDFRPSYRSITRFIKSLLTKPLVTAFTATATEEVTQDIVSLLSIPPNHVFITGFARENLALSVVRGENKRDYILNYLDSNREQAGIIYAATRKEVDDLYEFLKKKGFAVGKYHAGLSDEERATSQEMFLYDDIRIIVASNAFGMGIDKSNVRYVIHYNMPRTMESYYQEAGRAGRDGDPSECILLFAPKDIQVQKFLIEQTLLSPDRKTNEYKKLQVMTDYCHTSRCLRNYIVNYFAEVDSEPCGNCSSCLDEREVIDITEDAQKIFSCIVRTKERYGGTLIAGVLKGSKNKRVLQFGFNSLPTYGVMKQYTEKEITDMINVLIAEGYLYLTEGQYPVVKLKSEAVGVLKEGKQVLQKIQKRSVKQLPNETLFESLRVLRKEISDQERVPPYIIFSDSTLREMSEQCPTDEKSLLSIKGVGEAKIKSYGNRFIQILQSYSEENNRVTQMQVAGSEDDETPSHLVSFRLYQDGRTIDEIVKLRNLKPMTIQDHIIRSGLEGHEIDWRAIIPEQYETLIMSAIEKVGTEKLKPIKEELPEEVDYFAIKAVVGRFKKNLL